jgi:(1->4)-alpha-D-glucan 1-alpha-D-glucosylmutase
MSPDPSPDNSAALDRLAADAVALAAARRRTPASTYRLQFHKEFTLRDALRLVPYLDALGVSHVYASPILKARPGSHHGYDVVDHGTLNPEVGTEEDFAALARALADRRMGLLLDAVPNHMAIGGSNPWWADVLEHGPSSPYAEWFDIAWFDSPRPGMSGRLLLPVLGEPYGAALEGGNLKLDFDEGRFVVRYFDTRLPIDPRTYGLILGPAVEAARAKLGPEHPDVTELQSILYAVKHLPPRGEPDPERVAAGRIECAVIRRRLIESRDRFPVAAAAVREVRDRLAGTPGDSARFGPLDELLEAQAYRVCFWRVASDEINYRRFFDVNELAAIATEREDVFRAVHKKLLAWLAAGDADGLRIDHPDGLFDPKQYLVRLQSHYLLATAKAVFEANRDAYPGIDWDRDEAAILERLAATNPSPDPSPARGGEKDVGGESPPSPSGKGAGGLGSPDHPLYVVVEKILADNEPLPADWVCDGTTGYEFLNAVNGLLVDPAGEGPLTRLYQEFTGLTDPFPEVAYEKKHLILSSSLSSELTALAHQLDRLARLDRRSRDFTLNGIRRALGEVIAHFPVYRSYVNGGVHDTDKAVIGRAVTRARRRNPMLGRAIFHFIRDTLLLTDSPSGPASEEYRALQKRFAGKFQQLTAPVTAKGIEDTAFYVFNRFLSLNEVGGEPGRFGWSPERVHKYFADRQAKTHGSLSPLSTHDTKRSEDVRARLNVLAEVPGEWSDRIGRWAYLNRPHKVETEDGGVIPDANEEYQLYQTLVGAWPDLPGEPGASAPGWDEFRGRIQAYVRKALCEAKVHSSWINPDPDYEAAVAKFIDQILNPETSAEFLADLRQFVARVAFFGRVNSLAQAVVRCTAPGVPDTYQGTESWDFSLVDPDNRRPVDYAAREAWLRNLDEAAGGAGLRRLARQLAGELSDPRAKLFATAEALRCRRAHAELFARGEYVPAPAEGPKPDHVFAFLRRLDDAAALVVVPRLPVGLVPHADAPPIGREVWGNTTLRLPDALGGRWENVFTGETSTGGESIAIAEVLGTFPVAVLVRQ